MLTRSRPESCLSDLMLDRMVTGELVAPELETVRAHLATCEPCTARAAELQRESDEFAASAAPAPQPIPIDRARRRRRWLGASGLATIAAAAVIAVIAWPRTVPPAEERSKGGLALAIVVRHPDGRVATLVPGDPLSAGDAIRFKVTTDAAGYLGIIGIDAKPAVTAYVPSKGALPAIAKGRDQLIEGSIVLDDTLGAERIISVICPRAIDVAEIIAAGERALDRAGGDPIKATELETECRQTSFVITKVPR